MANTDKNFDRYFKEKLVNHEVKPSKLAWERLDSQLGKKGKAVYFPFMRIAAAIILLMGVGYIIWQVSGSENLPGPQTAEIIEIPVQEDLLDSNSEPQEMQEFNAEEGSDLTQPENTEKKKSQDRPAKIPQMIRNTVIESPKELLADHSDQGDRNQEQLIGIPELDLPELKLESAIAMNEPVKKEDEEFVEYKVIIKSNGLKNEPAKQGLISEIENKVDKIGGFLNKVEQGFADLQDAKENLFASNVPRRERSK
ncbi:hypothetical protein [Aquiflexum sp.]|uniref:hypothetical protein n=1 Tax=Aquiflexum sp. TaxID=1872584 RepID=UPI00359410DE